RAPLEHACEEGDADLVETLLEAGAGKTVGGMGEDGRTLLHAGAYGGSERVVRSLLNAGAKTDINTKLSSEWPNEDTPLAIAVRGGHEGAARVLVEAGADVPRTLRIFIDRGDENLARELLLAGADPNQGTYNRLRSPLVMASSKGFERLVRALLEKGADARGSSPLHAAARGGHVSTAEILIDAGFGVNDFDLRAKTPLHAAVAGQENRGTQVAMIDFLMASGADVGAQQPERDGLCESPLHTAAAAGNREGALALLQHGADVHAVAGRSDDLPLHTACCKMKVEVVELLLRWGADETAVNRVGHAAIDTVPTKHCSFSFLRFAVRQRLESLLRRAPNDRAWRRRSFFVLCRAHPRRLRLKVAPHAAADSPPCFDGLAAWLMALQDEDVFRHIVGFL
ncbi:unnamed protein product, partial [Hapterophycus canaliculatus]